MGCDLESIRKSIFDKGIHLMWFAILLQLSFAAPCKYPFPLHVNDQLVSACLKAEKFQSVGHMLFVELPKAVYSPSQVNATVSYFTNTKATREKLCNILNSKKQVTEYTLEDQSGGAIDYGDNGFSISRQAKALKMLACSVL
jgi:hypothetical protein